MKKISITLVILFTVILCCAWFVPKTNPEGSYQAPAVSTYIETIKGHEYIIVVATNTTNSYYASHSHCPTIAVSCIHSESCPCKKEKESKTNNLFE